ncbi:MAG: hypothetical protein ABL995_05655 [Bryobacteraceae bacterium]
MTIQVVAVALAAAVFIAAGLAALAWKMSGRVEASGHGEASAEPGTFRAERYRPMERLLLAEEFESLAAQPGFTREIGEQWLRGRRKIFRVYLGQLKRDFHRLHASARLAVAESGEESAELVGVLIRQQIVFSVAMTRVELRFAWSALGFRPMDIRPILQLIDSMRMDLERFAPQSA